MSGLPTTTLHWRGFSTTSTEEQSGLRDVKYNGWQPLDLGFVKVDLMVPVILLYMVCNVLIIALVFSLCAGRLRLDDLKDTAISRQNREVEKKLDKAKRELTNLNPDIDEAAVARARSVTVNAVGSPQMGCYKSAVLTVMDEDEDDDDDMSSAETSSSSSWMQHMDPSILNPSSKMKLESASVQSLDTSTVHQSESEVSYVPLASGGVSALRGGGGEDVEMTVMRGGDLQPEVLARLNLEKAASDKRLEWEGHDSQSALMHQMMFQSSRSLLPTTKVVEALTAEEKVEVEEDKFDGLTEKLKHEIRRLPLYVVILLHFWDIATDIGVVWKWLPFMNWKQPYAKYYAEDTTQLNTVWYVVTSLLAMAAYRLVSGVMYARTYSKSGGFVQFLDTMVFVEVYVSLFNNGTRSSLQLRWIRRMEAIVEAAPQAFLQLIYLLQTGTTGNWLIRISLTMAVLSIASSLVKADEWNFDSKSGANQKIPPHPAYITRAIFRLFEVFARLTCLAFLTQLIGYFYTFAIVMIQFLFFVWMRKDHFLGKDGSNVVEVLVAHPNLSLRLDKHHAANEPLCGCLFRLFLCWTPLACVYRIIHHIKRCCKCCCGCIQEESGSGNGGDESAADDGYQYEGGKGKEEKTGKGKGNTAANMEVDKETQELKSHDSAAKSASEKEEKCNWWQWELCMTRDVVLVHYTHRFLEEMLVLFAVLYFYNFRKLSQSDALGDGNDANRAPNDLQRFRRMLFVSAVIAAITTPVLHSVVRRWLLCNKQGGIEMNIFGFMHQANATEDHMLLMEFVARTPGSVNDRTKGFDKPAIHYSLSLKKKNGNYNYELFQLLCNAKKAKLGLRDSDGVTLLIECARSGMDRQLALLLALKPKLEREGDEDKHVDLERVHEYGKTALIAACESGHLTCVKLLTEAGADINRGDNKGRRPLHYAIHCEARFRNYKVSQMEGLSEEEMDAMRSRALRLANIYQNLVTFLLGLNPDLEARDKRRKWTPLMTAAAGGNVLIVSQLVQKGADMDVLDCLGQSLMHVAAKFDSNEVMHFLLEECGREWNLEHQNYEGETATRVAIAGDAINCLRMLAPFELAYNMKVSLLLAVKKNAYKVAEFLMTEYRVDPNFKDRERMTPLRWATYFGYVQMVRKLIEGGALDEVDSFKQNAVFYAARKGHIELLRVLEKGGFNFWRKNREGVSALDVARDKLTRKFIKRVRKQVLRRRQAQMT